MIKIKLIFFCLIGISFGMSASESHSSIGMARERCLTKERTDVLFKIRDELLEKAFPGQQNVTHLAKMAQILGMSVPWFIVLGITNSGYLSRSLIALAGGYSTVLFINNGFTFKKSTQKDPIQEQK